jgi:hypothetical protein
MFATFDSRIANVSLLAKDQTTPIEWRKAVMASRTLVQSKTITHIRDIIISLSSQLRNVQIARRADCMTQGID